MEGPRRVGTLSCLLPWCVPGAPGWSSHTNGQTAKTQGALGPLLLNTQGAGKPEGTAACASALAAGLGGRLPSQVFV